MCSRLRETEFHERLAKHPHRVIVEAVGLARTTNCAGADSILLPVSSSAYPWRSPCPIRQPRSTHPLGGDGCASRKGWNPPISSWPEARSSMSLQVTHSELTSSSPTVSLPGSDPIHRHASGSTFPESGSAPRSSTRTSTPKARWSGYPSLSARSFHGTGAVVTDPHEIANVAGLPGMEAMRAAARGLPLAVFFTTPSCVPASPWESPGAEFGPAEMAEMLKWPECVGLGELMNFPGVLAGDEDIARKLAVSAGRARRPRAGSLRSGVTGVRGSRPRFRSRIDDACRSVGKLRAGQMVMIRRDPRRGTWPRSFLLSPMQPTRAAVSARRPRRPHPPP